jgi:2-iminobutanoate/2-iminopropanoate deaminase
MIQTQLFAAVFLTLFVVPFAAALQQSGDSKNAQTGSGAQTPIEYSSAKSSANRPFSEVVRVGNMLYLSGKLGTDSSGKLAPGGIAAETKQTLENIRKTLEGNGSSLDQVVKCTVMLADMKEWAEMNSVYTTFFKADRRPARSAFGTSGLALNARVEIECVAVLK